ncbi:MAG: hypothetical protein JO057_04220 [Chloroflexi bacterium]|nr:hypothetical protein [Chloroflexota bacterium]
MTIQGRLWWVEHNVRMALRPEAAASQRQLAVVLLRDMEVLPLRISVLCSILQQGS